MSFLVNIALDKIKSGIQAHAKENGIPETDLYLMIYPKDDEFNPGFKIFNRVNVIREVTFSEFIKGSSIMGFPIDKEGEKWITKFLIKSANDKEIEHDNHFYFIRIIKNSDLQAYLYINNKPECEIPLDYILQTE
jgi:hypothetical protein